MAGFNIPSLQVPSRGLAPTISECSQSPSRPLENMTELFLRQKLITVVSIKKKKKKSQQSQKPTCLVLQGTPRISTQQTC